MSKKDRVIQIAKSGTCDDLCSQCPLAINPSYESRKYCNGVAVRITFAARAWLFDNGFFLADLVPDKKGVLNQKFAGKPHGIELPNKKNIHASQPRMGPIKYSLPKGVTQLSVDMFRDKMMVRVFGKNHTKAKLEEVLPFTFHLERVSERHWFIVCEEECVNGTFIGLGFATSEDGSCCWRPLAIGGRFLTDVLIVGCDDDVLNPMAHKKRNFRKLKT